MARFNEILVGRYNRYIQKLFAIKGGPPVAQVATEVGVQVTLFHGVETRTLEGWNRFAAHLTAIGIVAANSAVQIRCPSAVNMILAIEKIFIRKSVADTVTISQQGANPADLATVVNGNTIDRRSALFASAILSTTAGAGVASLNATMLIPGVQANIDRELILDDDQEWVLAPGDALRFLGNTVNQSLDVGLVWRERFLEDTERSLSVGGV